MAAGRLWRQLAASAESRDSGRQTTCCNYRAERLQHWRRRCLVLRLIKRAHPVCISSQLSCSDRSGLPGEPAARARPVRTAPSRAKRDFGFRISKVAARRLAWSDPSALLGSDRCCNLIGLLLLATLDWPQIDSNRRSGGSGGRLLPGRAAAAAAAAGWPACVGHYSEWRSSSATTRVVVMGPRGRSSPAAPKWRPRVVALASRLLSG